MRKAFKIDFHNGEPDGKTIVSMSVNVRNSKKFHSLDAAGKDHLISSLKDFRDNITVFMAEIIKSLNPQNPTI